jgi:hypothetical protein
MSAVQRFVVHIVRAESSNELIILHNGTDIGTPTGWLECADCARQSAA